MRIRVKTALMAFVLGMLPFSASADVFELSQQQMRQLVAQRQVLSAETVVTHALANFGGSVIDMRGFLSQGQMTYRMLIRRDDGSVIELLLNGADGRQVRHTSDMGKVVSSVARGINGASAATINGSVSIGNGRNTNNAGVSSNSSNRSNSSANSNSGNRGNSGASSNSGNRGNSAARGNSGNRGNSEARGNSGNRGNGGDRGNSGNRGNSGGGKGNGRGN